MADPRQTTDVDTPAAKTGDYSATKAPENRDHVESKVSTADPSQLPGGASGAPVDVGASGLDRAMLPDEARPGVRPDVDALATERRHSGREGLE